MKELFIEEYDKIMMEAEEDGVILDEDAAANEAMNRSRERFFDMCDEAKDRAKYK